MSETVVLTAARWWDGSSDRTRPHARVLVRDGHIARAHVRGTAPGVRTVDLGDRTLLPGLIDCHIHLSEAPPTELADTVSGRTLAALRPLRLLLQAGFTSARDLGSTAEEPLTVHLRNAQKAGLIEGPRLFVAPHLISARAGHGDRSTLSVPHGSAEVGALADGVGEIVRRVRVDARYGADWIKFAATGGLTSPSDDPGHSSYTEHEVRALVAAADDLGLPCATHAFSDEGIRRAVGAGVRSVEHACLASPETLDLIAERGIHLVPTLYAAELFLGKLDDDAFRTAGEQRIREKLVRHRATMRGHGGRVAAGRARIAFGTDAGVFPHADNWREFPAMTSAGLSPHRALLAATSTAADLLRRPDLGRIADGATADLVAVPADPFHDIEALHHVDFVMQGGTVHRSP
ncbi:amidohydrolase family protein [Streptomyces sp. NPDC045456]|uniref:metal-dependent hydrolase family protein n=1 Tax=unclassified Streptomyces TaxID=2593676 RepID=UPI0033C5A42D